MSWRESIPGRTWRLVVGLSTLGVSRGGEDQAP